jgi:hypothetical protein
MAYFTAKSSFWLKKMGELIFRVRILALKQRIHEEKSIFFQNNTKRKAASFEAAFK